MTARRELAELILESEDTGRAMQRRPHGRRTWDPSLDGFYDISSYEYRLEPKVVKHSGWFDADFLTQNSSQMPFACATCCVRFEWETEE